jgi:hypothetical protein
MGRKKTPFPLPVRMKQVKYWGDLLINSSSAQNTPGEYFRYLFQGDVKIEASLTIQEGGLLKFEEGLVFLVLQAMD